MSRSRRKTPISGITVAESEKKDKQIANRRLRHRVRSALATGAEVLPERREVSNVWSFDKDGKHWWDRKKDRAEPWYARMWRK
jgi:hypothetical protein